MTQERAENRWKKYFQEKGHALLWGTIRVFSALLAAAALYIMALDGLLVKSEVQLSVGSVATEDLFAPRDVEDTLATSAARKAARDAVGDIYTTDPAATQLVLGNLETCFEQLQSVRAMAAVERGKAQAAQAESGEVDSGKATQVYTAAFLKVCDATLKIMDMSDQAILDMMDMNQEDFDRMQTAILQQVQSALDNGIKADQLSDQTTFITRALRSEDYALTEAAQRAAVEIVSALTLPNLMLDEDATENARITAEGQVAPVMLLSGQSIVRKGEVITEDQAAILTALGLLNEEGSQWPLALGLAVVILAIFMACFGYLRRFDPEIWKDDKRYLLILTVALLGGVISWLFRRLSPLALPMCFAAMLYAVLLNRRVAYVMNALLAVYAALLTGEAGAPLSTMALPVFAATIVAGMAAISMLTTRAQRGTIMLAGFAASGIYLLIYSAFFLLVNDPLAFVQNQLLSVALYALIDGLGISMLVLGSFPLWEAVFRQVTPMKLLELTNPNQPLLRQLLLEAPGTYHHSVIVGNLAEPAAEAVGANPMLTRCGAFYHDIGKTRRPLFFKENQNGVNPHDDITAALSAKILVSHVTDGVELAKKYRLPQEIINIIASHHGDTLTAYFYVKAQKEAEDPAMVLEADFRYPGPPPMTAEEGIVMLADSCEAAVRSMKTHGSGEVEDMVRRIIKGKRDDGQLDNCDLTLAQIETITRVFLNVLGGIYHSRIEYPTMEKKS